ncbi:MAG: YggU family protein [Chloroflexi bacterium]|nr:YggU family protein [Chloroflexota bacterium]
MCQLELAVGRIKVRVQPGAPRSQILGLQGDVVRVKVAAPPVEGKANKALIALLAETLGVAKADVCIVAGQTARAKLVDVSGLSSEELRHRLVVAGQSREN